MTNIQNIIAGLQILVEYDGAYIEFENDRMLIRGVNLIDVDVNDAKMLLDKLDFNYNLHYGFEYNM